MFSAGFAGADMFHVAVFAWALFGFASLYHGAARRAFDLSLANAHARSSIALSRSMAHHPEVQHHVAEMHGPLPPRQYAACPRTDRQG
jgi:alkylation response protein AidB-like acyl-CoA dehydrogenase